MRAALAIIPFLFAAPVAAEPIPAAGRIEYPGSVGTCSAALVAPDVVLTAAHCAVEDGPKEGWVFRTGDGPDAHAFEISHTIRHPLYDEEQDIASWKYRFDIAAARLAEPVPDWVAAPFHIGAPAEVDERLFIVSWRRSDGPRPRQRACRVIAGLRGLVTMACPVLGGESGAPVLRSTKDGTELVAVVSSRTQLDGHPVAMASNARLRLPPILDLLD